MPTDDLDKLRALRADLRALKAQYPELTSPEAQARLEEYLQTETEKEDTHARKRRPTVRRGPRQPQPQSPKIRPPSD